ncbi:MAG TPA: hypothetical protein VN948_21610 [Terriglobales bacterium]|nr:hypothetical protein [Terriglobales bacterium]
MRMPTEIEMLTKRLERVENENRMFKAIVFLIVLVAALIVSTGAQKAPRVVEAEKIVLRDSQGRARLTIGTPAAAGVAIDMDPDDPAIWLTDEKGTDRAALTADGLRFANVHGQPLVEIKSDPRPGRSGLRFYGTDGKISWSAP